MIDQLMVGQLGSTAVSAVEVAGRPSFVYCVVLGAVATIAGIMISQYLGMEDRKMADRSLWVNLVAATALALLLGALCFLFPDQIVGLYIKDDPSVLAAGQNYLTCILWAYLPMGLSPYGPVLHPGRYDPMPGPGRLAPCLWHSLCDCEHRAELCADLWTFRVSCIRRHRRGNRQCGLSVGQSDDDLGQNVNTFIYGHLKPGDLAAMSLTGPIQGLFIGALSGVSQAAGILIGKRLGANEFEEAYQESKKLVWYGIAGSLLLSALLIGLRRFYVPLYKVEPGVQDSAAKLLLAFAILAPVKVANMILGGGVLRSGGKTAYIMVIDIVGTWLAGVPLGLITAFLFHLPVEWVYFILSQEELVRLGMTLIVFRQKKWMNRLSETMA